MTFEINEPTQKISKKAITVWRIKHLINNSMILLVLITLLIFYYRFNWLNWIGTFLIIMIVFVILVIIYDLTIHPIYLQRTWRYEVDEQIIQIKFGFFNKQHTIIPLSRVEYVNTNQGPLLRKYHLASVSIGTIASQHEIPALTEDDAQILRNKIISLAQLDISEDNEHKEILSNE